MAKYFQFLLYGLILGLFTEFELKLVAGIKPHTFLIALFAYPVILSLSFAASRVIDSFGWTTWRSDLLHYFGAGTSGLAIEWVLLGNGPGSNAIQLGMFGMWTTFCFGPRVLVRAARDSKRSARIFWIAFAATAALLTMLVILAPGDKAPVVVAALGLSGLYIVWSIWLLVLAYKSQAMVRLSTSAAE